MFKGQRIKARGRSGYGTVVEIHSQTGCIVVEWGNGVRETLSLRGGA